MTLATRIAVMRSGRIEQYAAPDTLYEQPETLFVAGFVGSPSMNFLNGELIGGLAPAVRVGATTLPLNGYAFRDPPRDGRELVIGIRPEHIGLATAAQGQYAVAADTLFMEPMGADTLGWFQCGEHRIAARLSPQAARRISGLVRLNFEMDQISLFDPASEARL
jgi:multiple sugar transport system ATP-binding protein